MKYLVFDHTGFPVTCVADKKAAMEDAAFLRGSIAEWDTNEIVFVIPFASGYLVVSDTESKEYKVLRKLYDGVREKNVVVRIWKDGDIVASAVDPALLPQSAGNMRHSQNWLVALRHKLLEHIDSSRDFPELRSNFILDRHNKATSVALWVLSPGIIGCEPKEDDHVWIIFTTDSQYRIGYVCPVSEEATDDPEMLEEYLHLSGSELQAHLFEYGQYQGSVDICGLTSMETTEKICAI
jgi:hypothetical protein